MEGKKVLYQIKSLEKMIVRELLKEVEMQMNHCQMSVCPTPTQMQIMEYMLAHEREEIFQKELEDVLKLRRATVSRCFANDGKKSFDSKNNR